MTPASREVPAAPRSLLERTLEGRVREVLLGDLEEGFHRIAERRGEGPARRWYWKMALRSAARALLDQWAGGVRADAGFALRRARSSPAEVGLLVLPLVLAVAATASVVTLARASLGGFVVGVSDPESLALVEFRRDDGAAARLSIPDAESLVASLERRLPMAPYNPTGLDVVRSGSAGRSVRAAGVLAPYFRLLGVRPAAGRLLTDEELDASRPEARILISERLWDDLFGRDPGAVGEVVRLNGHPMRIVGVVAAFQGLHYATRIDVWFNAGDFARLDGDVVEPGDRADGRFFQLLARADDAVDLDAVEASLGVAYREIMSTHPSASRYVDFVPRITRDGIGLSARGRDRARQTLGYVAVAALLIFVLACANAGLLLLLRGLRGQHQIAVRSALGASRGRLLRHHLVESVLLALGAGIGGLALSAILVEPLSALLLPGLVASEFSNVAPALAGAVVVGVLAATVGFGTVPAWFVTVGAPGALRGRRSSHETPRTRLLQAGLNVVQVGLCLALLAGSVALLRSVGALAAVELGMSLEGVRSYQVDPSRQAAVSEPDPSAPRRLADRLRSEVWASDVALTALPPVGGSAMMASVGPVGGEGGGEVQAMIDWIDDRYLELLRIDVLRGRPFRSDELWPDETVAGSRPVLINQALAAALFGAGGGVGGRLAVRIGEDPPTDVVVGVVSDVRTDLVEPARPRLYLPVGARPWESFHFLVRSGLPFQAEAESVAAAASEVVGDAPVSAAGALSAWRRRAEARPRAMAWLVSGTGLVAGLLAGLGLYGTLSFAVTRRRREMGVRVALGASASSLARTVLGWMTAVTALGLLTGLAGGAALIRVLRGLLFGVEPLDPLSFAGGVAAILFVVLAAAAAPVVRATRVDPVEVLRAEG